MDGGEINRQYSNKTLAQEKETCDTMIARLLDNRRS